MSRKENLQPATSEQLSRLYHQHIVQAIQQVQNKIPEFEKQYIGEDISIHIYREFKQAPAIAKLSNEDVACLFCIAFGASVKTSVEQAIPLEQQDRAKQVVYKMVRDKRELMGVRRAKDTFLNGQQLHDVCVLISKEPQVNHDVVYKALEEAANRLFGAEQWERCVLSDGYCDQVVKKVKYLQQHGGNEMNLYQVHVQKMQEVTKRLQQQQQQLSRYYLDTQPVPTRDIGQGSFNYQDDSTTERLDKQRAKEKLQEQKTQCIEKQYINLENVVKNEEGKVQKEDQKVCEQVQQQPEAASATAEVKKEQ